MKSLKDKIYGSTAESVETKKVETNKKANKSKEK